MNRDTIYTAEAGGSVFVKVKGRATFRNSLPLKKWLLAMADSGCARIVIDLKDCISLDSTFMGIATGFSKRMKDSGRDPVMLLNTSSHNVRLLKTLGLDRFLDIREKYDGIVPSAWQILHGENEDKLVVTEHMLEAHEKLIDSGTLAEKQFRNVHKLLKEDLEKQKKKKETSN